LQLIFFGRMERVSAGRISGYQNRIDSGMPGLFTVNTQHLEVVARNTRTAEGESNWSLLATLDNRCSMTSHEHGEDDKRQTCQGFGQALKVSCQPPESVELTKLRSTTQWRGCSTKPVFALGNLMICSSMRSMPSSRAVRVAVSSV
jgi:hypothetical protein